MPHRRVRASPVHGLRPPLAHGGVGRPHQPLVDALQPLRGLLPGLELKHLVQQRVLLQGDAQIYCIYALTSNKIWSWWIRNSKTTGAAAGSPEIKVDSKEKVSFEGVMPWSFCRFNSGNSGYGTPKTWCSSGFSCEEKCVAREIGFCRSFFYAHTWPKCGRYGHGTPTPGAAAGFAGKRTL